MRIVRTIILSILALISLAGVVVLMIDGNLSRLTGHNVFEKGERIFPYTDREIKDISWMRVEVVGERLEAHRDERGVWWMSSPWNDRLSPRAAAAILQFTYSTSLVDELPLNDTVKRSMREFGVETSPVQLTLKKQVGSDRYTTLARYTLGSTAPWLIDSPDGKTTDATTYMRTDFYGANDNILVASGNILVLFKEGIRLLRDHRPLLLPPAQLNIPTQPKKIVISRQQEKIVLTRERFGAPWQIESPLPLATNAEAIRKLINGLHKLTANKVIDMPVDGTLPNSEGDNVTTITLDNFAGDPPLTLTLYPPDTQVATTIRATVSDRKAIFELPIKSESNEVPGVSDLPLTLNELRSQFLCNIDRKQLTAFALRSPDSITPIRIEYFPHGRDGKMGAPAWLYSSDDADLAPINEQCLFKMMKTLLQEPVAGFASDNPVDLANYGLTTPRLVLTIQKKDKSITIFNFGRSQNGSWYATELGKPSIYQLSPTFINAFPTESLYWKQNKLFNFSRFELREMSLEHIGSAPLILKYGYLDDTWEGTQNGKDVTVDLNNNRANRYLSELENMKVASWLSYSDVAAIEALKKPVFRLKLTFDPEQLETGIEDEETNSAPTSIQEITLEIAPAGQAGYSSFYFGKISNSPYFFTLNMDAVRILGASVFEQD